jgi:CO/xanthine dehydrogenase FAD-binding subunit
VSARYVRARSLADALVALEGASEGARLLAGGTDLMVELASGRTRPDLVIDIWSVPELRGIRAEEGGLRFGALTTCRELVRSPLVRGRASILMLAAGEVGAEQIQARATIGGNLGTASPAADLTPVFFALGARVRLASNAGVRELSVEAFLTGYRATARRPNELIESVFVPDRARGTRRAFRKVGTRRAQSISKIVVALSLDLHGKRVDGVRAAAGSVADRTIRLATLERALLHRELTPRLIASATRACAQVDAAPIDDVRSTAAYRRHALQRVLAALLSDVAK